MICFVYFVLFGCLCVLLVTFVVVSICYLCVDAVWCFDFVKSVLVNCVINCCFCGIVAYYFGVFCLWLSLLLLLGLFVCMLLLVLAFMGVASVIVLRCFYFYLLFVCLLVSCLWLDLFCLGCLGICVCVFVCLLLSSAFLFVVICFLVLWFGVCVCCVVLVLYLLLLVVLWVVDLFTSCCLAVCVFCW